MSTQIDPAAFDYSIVYHACECVIAKNPGLRIQLGYLDRRNVRDEPDELAHDLAADIWMEWQRGAFDPTRSKLVTWATMVAWSRLNNRAKKVGIHIAKLQQFAAETPEKIESHARWQEMKKKSHIPLPRKLHKYKLGRLGHPPEALRAALHVAAKNGWSNRELSMRLKADPELLKECGFSKAPSRTAFNDFTARFESYAKRYKNGFVGMVNRVGDVNDSCQDRND